MGTCTYLEASAFAAACAIARAAKLYSRGKSSGSSTQFEPMICTFVVSATAGDSYSSFTPPPQGGRFMTTVLVASALPPLCVTVSVNVYVAPGRSWPSFTTRLMPSAPVRVATAKLTREGEARLGLGCGAGGSGVIQSWDGSAAHLTCSGVTFHASCAGSYHSQDQNSH